MSYVLGAIVLGTPVVLTYFKEDMGGSVYRLAFIFAVISALCLLTGLFLSSAHPLAAHRLFITSGLVYTGGLISIAGGRL